ncbi:MAG: ATP-binding cassette domain-containing protein [Treponema sp.]|nr:ATP-binding cassette domain-containing protein [Treponema sp.]
MKSVLKVEDLTVTYGGFTALDRVSLELPEYAALGLVGESGSGKTTLARVIAGLITPDAGRVLLGGEVLGGKRGRNQYKTIQIVFQNPDASLNPRHRVRHILREALLFHKIVPPSRAEDRCRELLARVQLDEDALDRFPHEFSGGQRQRIAIARALSVEPGILIADEPTSALDVSVQLTMLKLLRSLKSEFNLTMLFISHDLGVINAISDTVAVMRQGRLIEVSKRERFFSCPQTAYGRELLSAVPRMPPVMPANSFPAAKCLAGDG